MTIEQYKNEIKSSIEEIKKFDLSRLYPDHEGVNLWHDVTSSETKKIIEFIVAVLKKLGKNLKILDTVGVNHIENLNLHLANFITHFNEVDVLDINSITNQHHVPLNDLNHINNTLRNSDICMAIMLEPELENKLNTLRSTEPLFLSLVENKEALQNAIDLAQEWLKHKAEIDERTIRGQATAFQDRALAHRISRIHRLKILKWKTPIPIPNYWFIGLLFFAGVVFYFTYSFIDAATEGITSAQVILRMSSLIVPAYLTAFSANQFLYHKKMHEAYMFRYASLHTMNSLMSTWPDPMKQKILEKGLGVLFTEPTAKEDGTKHDKQIISELIGMLKTQIK